MSIVSRTFTNTTITAKCFDHFTDEIVTRTALFPERVELSDSKKKLEKSPEFKSVTVLKVLAVDYDPKRKGMTEEDFMTYGYPVAERSKDTRGMVSKEIIGQVAECVTVNNESFKVEDRSFVLPRKMSPEEVKRYYNKHLSDCTVVKVIKIREEKALWVMSPETFLRHSFDLPPYPEKGEQADAE